MAADPGVDSANEDASALSEERDELVRELARLQAMLATVTERLRDETARATSLQERLDAMPPKPVTVGASSDGFRSLTQDLKRYVDGSDGPVPRLIAEAAEAIEVKADYAVLECRKVTERIAERWWCAEFDATDVPRGSRFGSLLGDLRPVPQDDRGDIEWATWSYLKGVHSLANLAAHPGNAAERLRAVAALTGVVEIATSLIPAVHREIRRRRALPAEDWRWD